MYSYQLLERPRECTGCGSTVTTRLAGHYYRDTLCETCLPLVCPELADAFAGMRPVTSVETLEVRAAATCANCGDVLTRAAGHHYRDPLCVACFREHAPELAALLLLHEAAIEAAETRDAEALLKVAIDYVDLLDQLDAEYPRNGRS